MVFCIAQKLTLFFTPPTQEDLDRHADLLANFLPMLHLKKEGARTNLLYALKESYLQGEVLTKNALEEDQEFLSALILEFLQQLTQRKFNYVDWSEFNQQAAIELAETMLEAFEEQNHGIIDSWYLDFQNKLLQHIETQLLLINGKNYNSTLIYHNVANSLSHAWDQYVKHNFMVDYLADMSSAHGFLNYLGCATENNMSVLGLLDLHNYHCTRKKITEVKFVLAHVLRPMFIIYLEYKDIAFYVDNPYMQMVRTLMPMLIMAACVIGAAILLAPLDLPALTFAAVFIPTLYISVAVAAQYVWLKNNFYNAWCDLWSGGHYHSERFRINPRLTALFGEHVQSVKQLYVEEIEACYVIERAYQAKEKTKQMTQDDFDLQKENNVRKEELHAQWYDLHSNGKVPMEKAPLIARAQIRETVINETQRLSRQLGKDRATINEHTAELTAELKSTFTVHAGSNLLTLRCNNRFFQPECLTYRRNAEKWDALETRLPRTV